MTEFINSIQTIPQAIVATACILALAYAFGVSYKGF